MNRLTATMLFLLLPVILMAQGVNRYDVVITEFMADPVPVTGLPNNEWIEIKNVSATPVNLQGWRMGDATSLSGELPFYILQPDSLLIICTNSAVNALSTYGNVIAVTSFPSLDNNGDLIFLRSAESVVIHAIEFTLDWYDNALKQEGGWSLEMIDTKIPCAGSANWKASINPLGGTPGSINSINGHVTDFASTKLNRAYNLDNLNVVLVFNNPVDSTSASLASNYQVDNGQVISAKTIEPLFNHVQLTFSQPMLPGNIYTITVTNMRDCNGQLISIQDNIKVGISEEASTLDIVVNEILFNPRSNANDFIEIYNRSQKLVDASGLFIANRNSSGVVSSARQFTDQPWLIFPGDHIVVTTDLQNLQLNYLVKHPGAVIVLPTLPSFPDDDGHVLLLNKQGEIVDEVNYNHNWHFKLIDNKEGVSLERIDPESGSQQQSNWQSAASTAGYGTPTYVNSQFRQQGISDMEITVIPKLFSPDNDGHEDFTMINYLLSEPGFVANVTIFDAAGRPVKHLLKNGTLSQQGSWKWDGLDNDNQALPVGNYIIFTEIFNLQGATKKYKNIVVLARRL